MSGIGASILCQRFGGCCWAQMHGITLLTIDGLLLPEKVGPTPCMLPTPRCWKDSGTDAAGTHLPLCRTAPIIKRIRRFVLIAAFWHQSESAFIGISKEQFLGQFLIEQGSPLSMQRSLRERPKDTRVSS
jgi:hypothetical protein